MTVYHAISTKLVTVTCTSRFQQPIHVKININQSGEKTAVQLVQEAQLYR